MKATVIPLIKLHSNLPRRMALNGESFHCVRLLFRRNFESSERRNKYDM